MKKIFSTAIVFVFLFTACAKQVTGADVVASFKTAGLEAESTHPMTKDDYGPAPYVCTGTRFLVPSIGADSGGRIYICDNTKDRDAIANYYTEMGKASAMLFSWVFVKDNIVIQINGDLSEDIARKYEAAIP
jgi:hypothetical protein